MPRGCTMGPAGSVDFEDLMRSSRGGYFVDPDFPADETSIWTEGTRSGFGCIMNLPSKLRWMRPHEFKGVQQPGLFTDDATDDSGISGAEANDIIQSPYLGNCYFLSALSIMCGCRETDMVPQLFISTEFFNQGLVGVKFFKEGIWWDVAVDTLVPTADGKVPVFARNKDINEWWLSIIEKAYAKMHGCYEVLDAGFMNSALRDMTGAAPGDIEIKKLFSACKLRDGSFDKRQALTLLRGRSKGILLQGASAEGDSEEAIGDGLHSGHAYSINQVKELSCGTVLVQMRNPWGGHEWTGKWSDKDTRSWTPQAKKEVGHTDAEDGMFWMSVDDFAKKFTTITFADLPRDGAPVYRAEGSWSISGGTAGGSTKKWACNPQILMRVTRKQDITITLSQPDTRMLFSHFHQNPPLGKDDFFHLYQDQLAGFEDAIGFMVFKGSERKAKRTEPVAQSDFSETRTVSLTMKDVQPGDYIIVPFAEYEGLEHKIYMRFFCEHEIELIDTRAGKDWTFFEASVRAAKAGMQTAPLEHSAVTVSKERVTGTEMETFSVKRDPFYLKDSGLLRDIEDTAGMSSWKVGDFAPKQWQRGTHWTMSQSNRFAIGEMCCIRRGDAFLRFAKVERDVGDGTYDIITSMTDYGLARKHFVPAKFLCKLPHEGKFPIALLNQINEVFDIMDTDRSGHLEFKFCAAKGFVGEMAGYEGKKLLMDCGVEITDLNKLAAEMKVLDKNGDGMIDRDEVLLLCRENPPCFDVPKLCA